MQFFCLRACSAFAWLKHQYIEGDADANAQHMPKRRAACGIKAVKAVASKTLQSCLRGPFPAQEAAAYPRLRASSRPTITSGCVDAAAPNSQRTRQRCRPQSPAVASTQPPPMSSGRVDAAAPYRQRSHQRGRPKLPAAASMRLPPVPSGCVHATAPNCRRSHPSACPRLQAAASTQPPPIAGSHVHPTPAVAWLQPSALLQRDRDIFWPATRTRQLFFPAQSTQPLIGANLLGCGTSPCAF